MIKGLEDVKVEVLKNLVVNHFNTEKLSCDSDIELKEAYFIGSRINKTNREDSDLDVLVIYEGEDREDDVFSMLNEEQLVINDIVIDFVPYSKSKRENIEITGDSIQLI